ncbi:hypothetical protein F5148DRAFT_1201544, partial [Russula earlei]
MEVRLSSPWCVSCLFLVVMVSPPAGRHSWGNTSRPSSAQSSSVLGKPTDRVSFFSLPCIHSLCALMARTCLPKAPLVNTQRISNTKRW